MTTLTEDMKRVVHEQRLGYVATVYPDGTPNLSPKGTVDLSSFQNCAILRTHPDHTNYFLTLDWRAASNHLIKILSNAD